jgi:hypothetical protein
MLKNKASRVKIGFDDTETEANLVCAGRSAALVLHRQSDQKR